MSPIKRVFSGIQPSGVPHIGNYVGAIKNWVKLQNGIPSERTSKLFCIVDLHALTVPTKPNVLKDNIFKMLASLIASGITPEKSIIFQQSQVPFHGELTWYLSCIASTGQLKRMHQWKTKAGKEKDEANLGLFSYPVLMSADVLLYRATHVPVGNDQVQHMELARDLVHLFNKKYREIFPLPEVILSQAPRIMSLRNPKQKMSKSDANINSRIDISDSNDLIVNKLKKAVTDSEAYLSTDLTERHGVQNLITIYSSFIYQSQESIVRKYSGIQYFTKALKEDISEVIINELAPIRKRYEELLNEKNYLESILQQGNEDAKQIARQTISEVHDALGLL